MGFIEKEIIKTLPDLNITTYDYANTANKWLSKIKGIKILTSLDGSQKYKFIYCTQLLYSLSNNDISELLKLVKAHLDKNGVFLTVDPTYKLNENSEQSTKVSFSNLIKNLLLLIYYSLFKRNVYQLWGWQRDSHEIKSVFNKNGFSTLEVITAAGQSFIIFNIKNNS